MKKGLCIIGIFILSLLVTGLSWADNRDGDDPEWTFIYYLAADNDQETYADNTIDQLLAGTASIANHPQILVMIDRLSVTGTEIFAIKDGEKVPMASYPEQDTSDSTVLQDFATYALGLAEHDKVAFVMKSEGLSWRGIGRDNTHAENIDDGLMSNGALAGALIAAQAVTGRDVDLLVLEGSIMAFMEVVYELRDAAPMLVASQSKIQPDGIPWEMVIKDLGATPDMTSKELGITITDNHIEYYSDKGNNGVPGLDTSTNFAAMTVFDLSNIYEVLDAHMDWAQTTWLLFDEVYNLLPHARDLAEVGGFGEVTDFDYNFDIETFMVEGLRLIDEEGLDFPELTSAVEAYLEEQDDLIIYERNPADGFKLKAASGLSIWYPPTWDKYDTRDESDEIFGSTMYYEDPEIGLDWVVDSNWRTYLFEYFDRADAKLAGNGTEGDEPPKKGVFDKVN
ncbi:MAG: clostripain-related cysteine peptidase [Desulfobulbaceae bacterium]|nr:clostripain-related cysteine peptidase [Desulfobulbaceae bacterium]